MGCCHHIAGVTCDNCATPAWTYMPSQIPVTRAEFDALTQRVAKLEAPQNVGAHCRDADIVSVPGYPGKENPTRREELAGRVTDPPAAPSLLPCPFCGEPPSVNGDGDAWVWCNNDNCGNAGHMVARAKWNRRTPADARLRALAEAVVNDAESSAIGLDFSLHRAITALAAYLRETAR